MLKQYLYLAARTSNEPCLREHLSCVGIGSEMAKCSAVMLSAVREWKAFHVPQHSRVNVARIDSPYATTALLIRTLSEPGRQSQGSWRASRRASAEVIVSC